MRKKYILFDLDGTLTDSSEGITKSVQYALDKLGITENDEAVLKRYIGPPLDESFAKFHGLSREDALKAVNYYRERYKDTGIYENRLFDGIKELLSSLKKEGYITALATCKPEIYVPTILKYFDIEQYFDIAVGSELEGGARRHKDDVINEVFNQIIKLNKADNADITNASDTTNVSDTADILNDIKADSIMIGDRKDDILGAKNCGIESIGVRYGFAEENEYSEDTLKALQEFPVNDFTSYSGKLYAYPELNVVRYSCPDGVGDSLEDLLNVSNCTPVYGSTTPYQYGNTKYVLTLSNGGNFCKANEPCYLGLKLQMNRYSYVHLYDEEGKIITFDYHQYVNQDYKNLRGFYTNKPVKTIVVKPMINEGDNTNMNGFAVYEEGYSSYLNCINAIKANPILNVKKSTNKITFSTNFAANKIVVTTIPYDAGWTLTRKDSNGVVTTPQLFKAQGGFCAFVGEANQMEYEMTYFTPQLKQGLVVSLMGFILFGTTIAVFNYIDKKKKGTKNNKVE